MVKRDTTTHLKLHAVHIYCYSAKQNNVKLKFNLSDVFLSTMLEYPSLPIETTLFINSCKQYQSLSNIDYTLSRESIELSNDLLLSVHWNKVTWLYVYRMYDKLKITHLIFM